MEGYPPTLKAAEALCVWWLLSGYEDIDYLMHRSKKLKGTTETCGLLRRMVEDDNILIFSVNDDSVCGLKIGSVFPNDSTSSRRYDVSSYFSNYYSINFNQMYRDLKQKFFVNGIEARCGYTFVSKWYDFQQVKKLNIRELVVMLQPLRFLCGNGKEISMVSLLVCLLLRKVHEAFGWLFDTANQVCSFRTIRKNMVINFAYILVGMLASRQQLFELLYGRKCRAPICWDEVAISPFQLIVLPCSAGKNKSSALDSAASSLLKNSRANGFKKEKDAPLSISSPSNKNFSFRLCKQIALLLEDKLTIKMNQMKSQMKSLVVPPAPVKADNQLRIVFVSIIHDFGIPIKLQVQVLYQQYHFLIQGTRSQGNNYRMRSFLRRASIPCPPHLLSGFVCRGDVNGSFVPPHLTQKVQDDKFSNNNKVNHDGTVSIILKTFELKLPPLRGIEEKLPRFGALYLTLMPIRSLHIGKFTYPADFVVVDYVPDEQIPLILGRPFLRTARALIDVYDEKLILRDGNESLNMYSGSPTIPSDDSFPSSSPVKTSDNIEKFTDELAPLNSLPPGNDDSTLKKEFHEVNFQVYSNPLFEFDESFKSSNVNPLFEENNKDVEIKSSSSITLTSPQGNVSIPPGIDLTIPSILEVYVANPTFLTSPE
ncbi:reverse transcriptase domain-containing protein [Tanacetum coccineum]